MRIVIDIDVRAYDKCLKLVDDNDGGILGMHLINAVAKGTPLPKGHGRLIDADALGEKLNKYTEAPYQYALTVFNGSPTILEADKEVNE